MNDTIHCEVHHRLDDIEREENVRIVYACESGSRAWGFASPDSDHDVRFLYVRPVDDYLSVAVELARDVIEPISAFIESELARHEGGLSARQVPSPPFDAIDRVFRATLRAAWA